MKHKLPKVIDGIPVESHVDKPTVIHGEAWVTMAPKDNEIERLWEFSITSGRILDMTKEVYPENYN